MESLKNKNLKVEVILSYVLISGVIISLLLMIAGMILFYLDSGSFNISKDPSMFIQGKNFFSFIFNILKDKGSQNISILLLTIGAIVLMLTPFLRVVASFFYFVWVKDKKYIFITLIVLVVLIVTLSLH